MSGLGPTYLQPLQGRARGSPDLGRDQQGLSHEPWESLPFSIKASSTTRHPSTLSKLFSAVLLCACVVLVQISEIPEDET